MRSGRSEKTINEVAAALEKDQLDRLFTAVSEIDLREESFKEFFSGLRSESDRALAIVTFAYIDERLRDLFEQALNKEVAGGTASLLEGIAPLSSSNARIQLAAALYWLRPDTYHNLRLLRKIRNDFAHDSTANAFSHRRIAGLLTSMHPIENKIIDAVRSITEFDRELIDRERFFIRCVTTCQAMITEMASAPIASRMGLPPHALYRRDMKELPLPVQALMRSASIAILEFIGKE